MRIVQLVFITEEQRKKNNGTTRVCVLLFNFRMKGEQATILQRNYHINVINFSVQFTSLFAK